MLIEKFFLYNGEHIKQKFHCEYGWRILSQRRYQNKGILSTTLWLRKFFMFTHNFRTHHNYFRLNIYRLFLVLQVSVIVFPRNVTLRHKKYTCFSFNFHFLAFVARDHSDLVKGVVCYETRVYSAGWVLISFDFGLLLYIQWKSDNSSPYVRYTSECHFLFLLSFLILIIVCDVIKMSYTD